ncbi:hypothetical protein ACFV0O_26020 [Kitasatospora sp. NPDC059577]|uniref:hypothetical protein n=1 Tax=unclassified Kitasatospora TaxID=2633591 RepID=UPI0036B8B8D1
MKQLNPVCHTHGPGIEPASLIGRRLVRLVASWHVYEGRRDDVPVDLWLIDDHEVATHVMSGTDWCLVVEASEPYEGYDMGDWGRIDVRPTKEETPFARHLGETVLGAWEEWEPMTGRMVLELDFPSGGVRCESWSGDLRIRAVDRPAGPIVPMT